jgi:uncharacterized protein YbjT (DUF2867 family)
VFVSGSGADEKEKSGAMWARIKGRTENAVQAMGFMDAIVFRPAMIVPKRGLRHNVRLYGLLTAAMAPLLPLIRALGGATSTEEIGLAMIAAAQGRLVGDPPKQRLHSRDINELAKQPRSSS